MPPENGSSGSPIRDEDLRRVDELSAKAFGEEFHAAAPGSDFRRLGLVLGLTQLVSEQDPVDQQARDVAAKYRAPLERLTADLLRSPAVQKTVADAAERAKRTALGGLRGQG